MESNQLGSEASSESSSPFPFGLFKTVYRSVTGIQYGGTVSLLLIVAGSALGGAYSLPSSRGILLSIAATGLFGAILLGAMTPEQFVTVSLTQSLNGVSARNTSSIIESLDLAAPPRYVPTDSGIRLYIPAIDEMTTPPDDELEQTLIDEGDVRGLVLEPSGSGLLDEFEREGGALPQDGETTVEILISAIVDQLHLADEITVDSIDKDHVTLRVVGSIFDESVDTDDPIQSFFAVALATVLDTPVRTANTELSDRDVALMTLRWGDEPSPESESGDTRQ